MGCSGCGQRRSRTRIGKAAKTAPTKKPTPISNMVASRESTQATPIKKSSSDQKFYRPKDHWIPPFYTFVDEEQRSFKADTLQTILAQITQWRHERNMPTIPYLQDVVVSFTMLSNDRYIAHRVEYVPDTKVSLSVGDYVRGGLAYLKAGTVYDEDDLFCSQEEAERRAIICASCRANRAVVNGATKHSPNLAQSRFCHLKGDRKVSTEGLLNLCGFCTCAISCKIHFAKDFIKDAMSSDLKQKLSGELLDVNDKKMRCWIMEEDKTE